jgi:uroporphyrinogen-III decarboxylase
MEFYSAMKKNEILSFTGKWMELENIILSEVIQVQKTKGHVFSLICGMQAQLNISNITYTYKYTKNMYPKVGLIQETKGDSK